MLTSSRWGGAMVGTPKRSAVFSVVVTGYAGLFFVPSSLSSKLLFNGSRLLDRIRVSQPA